MEPLAFICNSTLSFLLDKYAPETVKRVPDRPDSAWYNSTIRDAKKARRRAERRKKSGLEVHRQLYKQSRNHCKQAVRRAESDHIQPVLDAAGTNLQKTVP